MAPTELPSRQADPGPAPGAGWVTPVAGTAATADGTPDADPRAQTIAGAMARAGYDRRTILRWCAYMAGVLALPVVPFAEKIAYAVSTQPRLPVLWLNGQGCTGDMEAFLRSANPTPSDLILNQLSIDYADLLMAPSGDTAEAQMENTIASYAGRYVLIVEGSIPTGGAGTYCCVGGRAFTDVVTQAAASAAAVIAVGSCAVDGGLPAAGGGVTGATSVPALLSPSAKKLIALPGCPMNGDNLAATLVQYITTGSWPATSSNGLPTFAYGSRIHQACPRRTNPYVLTWGDANHQAGGCLRKVGCQGPSTSANCPQQMFNSGTSFCILSGAPCISCTTPGFWDGLSRVFAWTPPLTVAAAPAAQAAPSAPPTPAARPAPAVPVASGAGIPN